MEEPSPKFDDSIEIGEILSLLNKFKILLVVLPIVAFVVAWTITAYLIPKMYHSRASVAIDFPDRDFAIIGVESFDLDIIVEMANDGSLRDQLLDELSDTSNIGLNASRSGDDFIILEVTSENSEIAANTANLWADILVERINAEYGNNQDAEQLQRVIEDARLQYDEKQADYVQALADNKEEVIETNLKLEKELLRQYLSRIQENQILLEDITFFEEQLSIEMPETALTVGQTIAIVNLYQRAVQSPVNNLLSTSSINSLPDEYLISEAKEDLRNLKSLISNQSEYFMKEAQPLELSVQSLAAMSEVAESDLRFLSLERDKVLDDYFDLLSEYSDLVQYFDGNRSFAKILARAEISENPVGVSPLINASLVGVAAFILSLLVVFALDWLRKATSETV